MAVKVSELPTTTTLNAGDLLLLVQGATSKAIASSDLISAGSIATGPALTTEDKVPQWDEDTLVLKDGLAVATTLGDPGSNSNLATEKAIRTALSEISGWASVFADITADPVYETEAAGAYTAVDDWAADTVYAEGDFVKPTVADGGIYECVTGGTSNDTEGEPAWDTDLGADTTEADGVVWRRRGLNVVETTSDLSGSVTVGLPLRYEYDGSTYYGVVKHVDDTRIAIQGAPLDGGESLTDLSYGPSHKMVHWRLAVPGAFGAGAAEILAGVAKQPARWRMAPAYCVAFSLLTDSADSTTQPVINMTINAQPVSNEAADDGVEPGTSWTDNYPVAINVANYAVTTGDAIEVECTVPGGTGDAADLTIEAIFVLT